MKHKKLIIFMPSIEGGGVEKNLFIVSSNCPNGPKEFIDNNSCGILFENNEFESLKDALINLCNEPPAVLKILDNEGRLTRVMDVYVEKIS